LSSDDPPIEAAERIDQWSRQTEPIEPTTKMQPLLQCLLATSLD